MRRLLLFLPLILISLSVVQVASALDTPSIEVHPAYVAKVKDGEIYGTPFAIKVSITGLTSGDDIKLKAEMVDVNYRVASRTWDGSAWQYSNYYVVDVNPDANGDWTGWVYVVLYSGYKGYYDTENGSIADKSTATLRIRYKDSTLDETSNWTSTTVNLLDMDESTTGGTHGGWIQGHVYGADGSALQNKIIVVQDSSDQIIGIYSTEDNSVDEGYSIDPGYYKVSAPAGTGYVMGARELDGTLIGNTTGVDIIAGGVTSVDIAPLDQPPAVTVTHPNGGEVLSGTVMVTWTASDPDNDTLTFDVQYSPDAGTHWTTLGAGLPAESYDWDTTAMTNGDRCLVKVIVDDGTNTAEDVSDTVFTINNVVVSGNIDFCPEYVAGDHAPFVFHVSVSGLDASTTYQFGAWMRLEGANLGYIWVPEGNPSGETGWRYFTGYDYHFTTDSAGAWSDWIYFRMRADEKDPRSGEAQYLKCKVRTLDKQEVITFNTTPIIVMNMSTGGGWIEGYVYDADGSLPLEDKIIIVKDSFNNIIGTYTSENNNVEEGHPANAGYYKLSAPTGDGYVITAQEKDGTVISSTPGISVIAGAPTTAHINMQGIRDLSVSPTDITFTPSFPTEGDDITITATIHNDGGQGETNVKVKFYRDSVSNANLIGTSTITSIASGGVEDVTITWDDVSIGTYDIHVVVTSVAGEINTTNNQATTEMVVAKSAEETTSEAVAPSIHPLYAADEIPFAVKVAVYGFPDGDYDVKVDITDKDGNRIGRIWNPTMSKWQSTFYYVNGVLVVNNGDGYYWACLKTSEYVGKATMVVTIRSNTTWKSGEYAMDIIDEGGWIEGSAAEDAIVLVKDDGNVAGTCPIVDGSYKLFVPFGNYTLEVREKDGTLLSRSSISVSIPRDEGGEEKIDATITTEEETIPSDVGDRRPSPTQIDVEKSPIPMIYLLVPLLTGISVTALFILRKIRRFERL